MTMVLKPHTKHKVLQLVEVVGKVKRTESYPQIRESAADPDIYEVALAIQKVKINPISIININLCAEDFRVVDTG